MRSRIIPTLLLQGRGLYKTVKFKNPVYVGDPINAVRIFNDKGADEIILLDIEASRTGREPNYELLNDIASEAFVPLTYGGGVTSVEQVAKLLRIGFEKVAINSAMDSDFSLLTACADRFGSQSVVFGLDVRRGALGGYKRVVRGGASATGQDPVRAAYAAAAAGAGEIVLTAVDRDGTMQGYDLQLVQSVASAVNVPLVASGGAANIADMVGVIHKGGASAAAGGAIFVFQGKHRAVLITYPSESEIAAAQGASAG